MLPTPAAPLLLGRYGFDLAVVLSASHNPYRDNGIKFFAADGYKLSDETELAIERELERARRHAARRRGARGDRARARAARRRARTTCASSTRASRELDLSGLRRAARLRQRRHLPGRPGDLQAARRERDGDRRRARRAQHQRRLRLDAHRALARAGARGRPRRSASPSTATATACWPSTAAASVVDGDELMALAALHLRARGRLAGDGVVVTVMTNYGFHAAMERAGIAVATTQVGDRYVLEELRARGWALGGEQSGHIIDLGFNRTGDGIASALLTLEALGGRDLSERDAMAQAAPAAGQRARARPRGARAARQAVHEAVRRRGRGARRPRARARAPERHRAARAGDGRGADRRGGRGRCAGAWSRSSSASSAEPRAALARPGAGNGRWYLRSRCAESLATSAGRPAQELLLAGLSKLEYRGYDSAGISVIAGDRIEAVRAVGNLSALRGEARRQARRGRAGAAVGGASPRRSRPRPASATRAGPRTGG